MPAFIDNATAKTVTVAAPGKEQQMRRADPQLEQALARQKDEAAQVKAEELTKPVERLNDVMKAYGLKFDVNRSAGRVVTEIVDIDSGETVRQIPNEAVLHIAESLGKYVGLLVEESA